MWIITCQPVGRSLAPKNTGKSDEKTVLRRNLSSGHTYVMDRWYAQFTLWNDIKAKDSSYVCRVRDNSVYNVIENRPLDQAGNRCRASSAIRSLRWV